MSWFKREDHEIVNDSEKTVRTEGLWIRCPDCGKILFKAELEANQQVCPHCGHHFRIDARTRIENLLEPGYELVDLGPALDRPAAVYRPEAIQEAACGGAEEDRAE